MAPAENVAPSGVIVTCPGCKIPMVVKKVSPVLSSNLETYIFRCEKCGTETKRELKREKP